MHLPDSDPACDRPLYRVELGCLSKFGVLENYRELLEPNHNGHTKPAGGSRNWPCSIECKSYRPRLVEDVLVAFDPSIVQSRARDWADNNNHLDHRKSIIGRPGALIVLESGV
jgi:hypothetical protein